MHAYNTLCICGGGGLGHTLAASISDKGFHVNLFTGHPDKWSSDITVTDCRNEIIPGHLHHISDKPEEVIPEADIILLCVPGFLVRQTLESISPFIRPGAEIGSVVCSNGFFWIARNILGENHRLFGFQRVPFISRVTEYGKSAQLKGYKKLLKIGGNSHSDLEKLASFFTEALRTETVPLGHYLEATLTNSNPILHTTRIYGMLSNQKTESFDKEFLFYEEWDDFSSEVLIHCDNEFQNILSQMPINRKEIPSILAYYESQDAGSLTRKIRSIEAFKGIRMAMLPTEGGFKVDYENRYFTEDIPYGLLIIRSIADLMNLQTPYIDRVITWMQEKMDKEYLLDGRLNGKDCVNSGIVQNYQIRSVSDLYNLNE